MDRHMADKKPAIILASINGMGLGQKAHLPASPQEIAETALACIAEGATIIHNHIDLAGVTGEQAVERYLEGWRPVLASVPAALFFPTVNWDSKGTINHDHILPLTRSGALRLGVHDMGAVPMGRLEAGVPVGDRVYVNSFDSVTDRLAKYEALGLGVAISIYGIAGLRHIVGLRRAGRLPRGILANIYFTPEPQSDEDWPGFFGIPPTARALDLCVEILADDDLPWTASLWGGDIVESGLAALTIERGGHLQVGLEPYGGNREPNNAELVREAAALCRSRGRPPATLAETASILDLPRPCSRADDCEGPVLAGTHEKICYW